MALRVLIMVAQKLIENRLPLHYNIDNLINDSLLKKEGREMKTKDLEFKRLTVLSGIIFLIE